ncbi:MAG: hypothetical protein ACRCTZ_09430 [Sarcina sp.]
MEYKYFVDFDRNRSKDGIAMRRYFADETGYEDILYWNSSCSVLEMLVGLSVQMRDMTEDGSDDFSAGRWFWEMMDNLELSHLTNNKYDEEYIHEVIHKFMYRKYEGNGRKHNIFVMEDIKDDLTQVELWYQMCWYLEDVYD